MVVPGGEPDIRAWKPVLAGVREVFHACFVGHAYPPHVHDVWTLFIVDDGAIRYDLHRRHRGADRSMVSILPPGVVHDGRGATSRGFRERVLYLEPSVLGERLIGPAVDRPVLPSDLRPRVSALHDALACADDALEAEERLADLVERIAAALGEPPEVPPPVPSAELAERLRSLLDAHVFEPLTMAGAAREIGVAPTQLARSFAETFAIPPHAYLVARRLEAARERILGGQALAEVAADVGFSDQAHMSRRFLRYMGTTPGRFQRAGRLGAISPA